MDSDLLGDISRQKIEKALSGEGLSLQVSDFRCLIRSDTDLLAEPLTLLYGDYTATVDSHGFYDFHINLLRRKKCRSDEVEFSWEGASPFPELPINQTHPLFEWGLNWCIATLSGADIVIHAAVVERHGTALVLPGQPGSGKSTLCAELSLSGWRLLSDELTIISSKTGLVRPIPRPISLKNSSIDIIGSRFPKAELTKPITDTRKGPIAYVRPPSAAVAAWNFPVPIKEIVFPRYRENRAFSALKVSRAHALTRLLENTFNVGLIGREGFKVLAQAVSAANCHQVEYSRLDDVTSWLDGRRS